MLIYDQHSIQDSPAFEALKPVLCPSFLALRFPKTLRDIKMRKVPPVHISCSFCSICHKNNPKPLCFLNTESILKCSSGLTACMKIPSLHNLKHQLYLPLFPHPKLPENEFCNEFYNFKQRTAGYCHKCHSIH